MKKKFTIEDLHKIAEDILNKAKSIEGNNSATVIALEGELGTGKTTLTQELARILGVKENIISPTFVIMKKYKVKDEIFQYLIHIDAYRLEKENELENLGFQEILSDKSNLVIVEWPSKVSKCIPKNACKLELSHDKDNTRFIKFHN